MSKKKMMVGLLVIGVIGMIVCCLLKKEEQKIVTLDMIKEFNGGVMPDYKLKENGVLLYLDGCFSERKVTSTKEALLALNDIKDLLGIQEAELDLKQTSLEEDELGYLFQFEQVYEGIYVYGSIVSLWADYDGNTGFLRSDCTVIPDDFVCEPTISLEEAQELLAGDVIEEYGGTLCIYETEQNVRLAWRIYVIINDEEYEILVDAEDGTVLYTCKTSCAVSEQKLQVTSTGLQGKRYTISIFQNKSGIYELQDKDRKIVIYNGGGGMSKFSTITSGSRTTWDLSAVSLMYHLRVVYDYYKNLTGKYSYNGAYFASTGNTVKAAINTGIKDNAYWSNAKSMILIGIGSGGSFYPISFAVAQDIVAHEFTHAVIANKTSLEHVYYGPAGAISEAVSDIMSILIEGDWKIGEDITKKKSLRDIAMPFNTSNPSEVGGGFYQDYKTNTADNGGVHKNSTVISHIAYVLYQNGMSRSQLAKLWYRSLCLGYGKNTDFYDVRVNVVAAAKELKFSKSQIEIINKAFDDANITKATCQESSNASYKSLYKNQSVVSNQSINTNAPQKEIILQWEREDLDLDLYVECLTKTGEKFVISYQNQEYQDKEGNVIARLVCDYTKGPAKEVVQIFSEDVKVIDCYAKVYGDVVVTESEWNIF